MSEMNVVDKSLSSIKLATDNIVGQRAITVIADFNDGFDTAKKIMINI